MNPVRENGKSSMWRLRAWRNIGSATDGELVAAVDWLKPAGILFGVVVFVGVALELAIAFFHPAPDSPIGNWGPVIGSVFVALGVLGVLVSNARGILCQGELTGRSNRRLGLAARMAGEAAERAAIANARAAEANERAAKAELALEQYRTAHEGPK